MVVDHTGYPADFIELDQDLEGELGIDTVKQAEIMAEIRTVSPSLLTKISFGDHPTLNHFTAYIVKMQGGEVSSKPTASDPTESVIDTSTPTKAVSSHEGTRRWQVEIEACPGVSAPIQPRGTVVVSDDGWGIAEAFCQRMEARGLKAVRSGLKAASVMLPVKTKAVGPSFEPTRAT